MIDLLVFYLSHFAVTRLYFAPSGKSQWDKTDKRGRLTTAAIPYIAIHFRIYKRRFTASNPTTTLQRLSL